MIEIMWAFAHACWSLLVTLCFMTTDSSSCTCIMLHFSNGFPHVTKSVSTDCHARCSIMWALAEFSKSRFVLWLQIPRERAAYLSKGFARVTKTLSAVTPVIRFSVGLLYKILGEYYLLSWAVRFFLSRFLIPYSTFVSVINNHLASSPTYSTYIQDLPVCTVHT